MMEERSLAMSGVRHASSPDALVATRSKPRKKTNYGLTKRVRLAVEILVWGYGDELVDMKRAAELAFISEKSLREAFTKPNVMTYYRQQLKSLREGERGNNIRTAIQIRNDTKLKASPTGQRVRLQAAQMLDQDIYSQAPTGPGSGNSVTINVVSPGYVIDLREGPTGGSQIEHLDAHVAKPMISLEDVSE